MRHYFIPNRLLVITRREYNLIIKKMLHHALCGNFAWDLSRDSCAC